MCENRFAVCIDVVDQYNTLYIGKSACCKVPHSRLLNYILIPMVSSTVHLSVTTCTLYNYTIIYTGLSKAVLATAVTVPLVVLLLIAAVIVIVAGVYWARLRRNRHYQFRCITMSQVQGC